MYPTDAPTCPECGGKDGQHRCITLNYDDGSNKTVECPRAKLCPECGGANVVSADLGLNWKPCPNPIHSHPKED